MDEETWSFQSSDLRQHDVDAGYFRFCLAAVVEKNEKTELFRKGAAWGYLPDHFQATEGSLRNGELRNKKEAAHSFATT